MRESNDLRQTWLRVYEAFGRGDAALLDARLARGAEVRTIGTDPQEWWDRAQLLRVIPGQVEGLGGPFRMESGALEAYQDGPVGWVADRVTAHLADGTTVPFRVTGVLH